jgi:D-alanine-D-alanine ligase
MITHPKPADCFYWVLAPHVETEDPNISYYYDFTQSIAEYTRVFAELNFPWQWQPVTIDNYREIIAGLPARSQNKIPLVINLCDGDETNAAPGVSVIAELQKRGLIYTGSDIDFYQLTTSKIPMKKAFDEAGISHAGWEVVDANTNGQALFEKLGAPLIVKPAVSGGSMGLSIKNVVHNETELKDCIARLEQGYRGWNLTVDGLIAERFIKGREFTTFVTGTASKGNLQFYQPVERVFHHSLPEEERFLSFDRLWETYDDETAMPDNGYVYEYATVPPSLIPALEKLSMQTCHASACTGYARMDIRMDTATGRMYMLEINAQCGLSEDEDYTSIGAILKKSGKTFTQLVLDVVEDALLRASASRESAGYISKTA